MAKKILIFSLAYYPRFTSGAEPPIKEITSRISPEDIEFHMVTLRFDSALPKVEQIGNVLIHRIGFSTNNPSFADLSKFPLDLNKPLFQFLAAFKALSLHRKYHYDSIWAMLAHSSGVPAAIFKILHPKTPFVLTLQEGDPTDYIEKKMIPVWPLFSRAFTTADIIQPISTFLANWARKRGFKGPLEIIHNGANPNDLSDSVTPAEIDECRKKVGKKEGDIFLVNTARLVHQKANDDTIRALPMLPNNVKLLLVGDGPDEQMLKDLAKELKVSDRVIFTGRVDRSEVTTYRKASDIFVCPSRSEGLGNALLSALASRLPLVATQEGGISEFLFDARRNPNMPTTGWAVDKDSPEQIAAAIKEILANPDKVHEVAETARQMVFEKFNWDVIAKDMREKVFGRVLKN